MPIRMVNEDGRQWPEGRAPYFHLAGSLVNRQLILVEGQARGWTSRRNGIVSFNRSTAISSCHFTPPPPPRYPSPTVRVLYSPAFSDDSIHPLVPHCCLFVTHLSLLPQTIFSLSLCRVESLSSYLVRSLTAYSLVPGLRRHYRWRALNVFCLFHLPYSLPSLRATNLSVPRSILPDATFSLLSL